MTEFASQLREYRLLRLAPDDYEVLYQLGIVLHREADIWGAIAVKAVQKIGDQGAWQQLIQTGLVEPKATMNNYDPNKVNYHVDHIEPLAKRWCDKGHDSDDSQRLHELTLTQKFTPSYSKI